MGVKFVGARKDKRGNITHLETNGGNIVTIQQARVMAISGDVDSLTDLHADGSWMIENSAGDNQYVQGGNLDQLPEF